MGDHISLHKRRTEKKLCQICPSRATSCDPHPSTLPIFLLSVSESEPCFYPSFRQRHGQTTSQASQVTQGRKGYLKLYVCTLHTGVHPTS